MTEYFISYYDCDISKELSQSKDKEIAPELCCPKESCPQRLGECEHWTLRYRCRLGDLTDEEFEYFKQKIDENNVQPFHVNMDIDNPHYILHSIKDISIVSLAAKAEHIRARKRFERLPDWNDQRQCTKIMGRVQDVADDVRELRQHDPDVSAYSPTEQEIVIYRIEAVILKKFTRFRMRAVARKKARLSERLQKWLQEKLAELDAEEAGLREDYEIALESFPITLPVKKKALIQPVRPQAVVVNSNDSTDSTKPESPFSAIPCSGVDSKPSPDGSWRTAREYASHMGKQMKTIQDWRYKGKKAADSMSGTDSKGTPWKRDKYNKTRVLYWLEHR